MTTAGNLTIKKFDGTTDITWSLIAASGGDKSPALWRSTSATGTVGQQPTFSASARWNTQKTVRRFDVGCSFPSVYTNTATGQTEVRATMVFSGSFAVPQNVNATDIQEFTYQVANLVAAMKTSIVTGYAPT